MKNKKPDITPDDRELLEGQKMALKQLNSENIELHDKVRLLSSENATLRGIVENPNREVQERAETAQKLVHELDKKAMVMYRTSRHLLKRLYNAS